jgi:hypothetical protein
MGLGKVHPQRVLGSVHLNPESVQPGQRIEGDLIPDRALLHTTQRQLKAIPLELFSVTIGLTLKSHLPNKQIERQPELLRVRGSLALP